MAAALNELSAGARLAVTGGRCTRLGVVRGDDAAFGIVPGKPVPLAAVLGDARGAQGDIAKALARIRRVGCSNRKGERHVQGGGRPFRRRGRP